MAAHTWERVDLSSRVHSKTRRLGWVKESRRAAKSQDIALRNGRWMESKLLAGDGDAGKYHSWCGFSHLETSAGRVALLLLGALGGGCLSARALAARRLSLSTGHLDIVSGYLIGRC